MQNKNMREEALRYHAEGQSGKIAVVPTKPLASQHDFFAGLLARRGGAVPRNREKSARRL